MQGGMQKPGEPGSAGGVRDARTGGGHGGGERSRGGAAPRPNEAFRNPGNRGPRSLSDCPTGGGRSSVERSWGEGRSTEIVPIPETPAGVGRQVAGAGIKVLRQSAERSVKELDRERR